MLIGKFVTLRAPEEADYALLCRLRNNFPLQMLLMSQPRANSPERVKEWVARVSSDAHSLFFIVAARASNQAVGFVQLTQLDFLHGTAELGICLDEAAQGKGFAGESLSLLEAYVRDVFHTRKIVLRVLAENSRAIAYYRKARYREVGVHKQHFYQRQAYHDVLIMEKLLAPDA